MFKRVVQVFGSQTLSVVESTCGGMIQSRIMAVPGVSKIFRGGAVIYDTKKSKQLLLPGLHEKLDQSPPTSAGDYELRKRDWARTVAKAYSSDVSDVALAEAGATGPTFNYGVDSGFSWLCVARRGEILAETIVRCPPKATRDANMHFITQHAADLLFQSLGSQDDTVPPRPPPPPTKILNRDTKWRDDSATDEVKDERDRFVVLDSTAKNVLVSEDEKSLQLLTRHEAVDLFGTDDIDDARTFLGSTEEGRIYSVLSTDAKSDDFQPCRTTAPRFNEFDRKLLLQATALAQWHLSYKFCRACGGETVPIKKNSARQCTKCSLIEWPRQDPSIIVVVGSRCGEKCLLARAWRHPPKLFAALAGFVEAGESFEDAVLREVKEEVGIDVDPSTIHYVGSQPWPFPRSTMIGFVATCLDDHQPFALDLEEIQQAQWFHRDDIRKATSILHDHHMTMDPHVANDILTRHPDLPCLLPPPGVIARTLIDYWLHRSCPTIKHKIT